MFCSPLCSLPLDPLQGQRLVRDWLPALVPLLGAEPRDVVVVNFGAW